MNPFHNLNQEEIKTPNLQRLSEIYEEALEQGLLQDEEVMKDRHRLLELGIGATKKEYEGYNLGYSTLLLYRQILKQKGYKWGYGEVISPAS